MTRERFLVQSYGDNIEGTEFGLAKLMALLGDHSDAVIVVPQIGQVKDTLLVKVLGEKLSKKLIKDRVLLLADGKKLSLCSHSTLKNYRHADLYLALWGTENMIMDIEDLTQWKAAILVTWAPKDSEKWSATYPVHVIYDDKKV
ncbi:MULTISPECIES: hypothetical protein [unclassified Thioalkalivibrio]|uniref:hypothetical protein n=1 Tax=unclassified Thioalkalivibrio TaxID=2621013 RepID=UPI0012DD1568|nr:MULTISPECIES: hypothetical protein [unclassified Thioalkalivibrio]